MSKKVKEKKEEKKPVKRRPRKEIAALLPIAKYPRRRAINKAINQQLIREQIAASNHHGRILQTLEQVAQIHEEAKKKGVRTREKQAEHTVRLGALKIILDTQFKLLAKYLPDVRAIEFKEGDGENPFAVAAKAWAEAIGMGRLE